VQKGIDMRKPMMHSTKDTKVLGSWLPHLVSQITVEVASTIEKAESMPSRYRVKPRMIAQALALFISSMAVG
jgi:hypothetical protein